MWEGYALKKILTSILCIVLLFSMALSASAIGMDSFVKTKEYQNNFSDLTGRWSETYIADLYEYGLVEGYGDGTVAPTSQVRLAEVITMAARINACYYEREIRAAEEGEEWYAPYVEYALAHGIVTEALTANVEWEANRGDTALIFSKVFIKAQYEPINQAKTFFDVLLLDKYYEAVSLLTSAGIVTGYEDMTFRPTAGVSREEAMTMADRLINKDQRVDEVEHVNNNTGATPGGDGIVPGSRDEEVGDSVTFHCEGVGVFTMNRRDEGYVLSVASGTNIITVAGLCEMRGNFLLCHLGERIVQGKDETIGVTNATTLLFSYDNGLSMTLVAALNAKGELINTTAKVLGDLSIGHTFKVAE